MSSGRYLVLDGSVLTRGMLVAGGGVPSSASLSLVEAEGPGTSSASFGSTLGELGSLGCKTAGSSPISSFFSASPIGMSVAPGVSLVVAVPANVPAGGVSTNESTGVLEVAGRTSRKGEPMALCLRNSCRCPACFLFLAAFQAIL